MASLTSQVVMVGNLTADPELRYTQNGQPVANFTVASTPRSFDKTKNEWTDGETVFQRCSLWGKPAEHFAASATKGTRVMVAGALKSRTFQDKDQNTRTAIELAVDEVGLSTTHTVWSKSDGIQKQESNDGWNQGFPAAGDETPF